jgi:hypothetical protein
VAVDERKKEGCVVGATSRIFKKISGEGRLELLLEQAYELSLAHSPRVGRIYIGVRVPVFKPRLSKDHVVDNTYIWKINMSDLNVLRTAKLALQEGLIESDDFDQIKRAFLKAQQIKAGMDAGE